jgi:hypothetical protein
VLGLITPQRQAACHGTSNRVSLLPRNLLKNLKSDTFFAIKSNNMKLIRVRERMAQGV